MDARVKYILELPIMEVENKEECLQQAQNSECDIIGLKFNTTEEIEEAKIVLKKLLPLVNKPLMIRGSDNDTVNKILLPELINILPFECIIALVNENTYKTIVPYVIKGNHKLVIRTPIDINLCKEMNILTSDMGLGLDKIIIDTDIGGLGYGLEYGYSIMEKIKLEGIAGDNYLNLPMISFAIEETSKTKEAKRKDLTLLMEIASASAVKAAGADYIVFNSEDAIKTIRGLL